MIKRFKAFIAHDGIFNMEMQYLETEEMWFANWDMGGAYWEKQNATAQRTFANSPHKFVDKWGYAYPLYPWRGRITGSWLIKEWQRLRRGSSGCTGRVADLSG